MVSCSNLTMAITSLSGNIMEERLHRIYEQTLSSGYYRAILLGTHCSHAHLHETYIRLDPHHFIVVGEEPMTPHPSQRDWWQIMLVVAGGSLSSVV